MWIWCRGLYCSRSIGFVLCRRRRGIGWGNSWDNCSSFQVLRLFWEGFLALFGLCLVLGSYWGLFRDFCRFLSCIIEGIFEMTLVILHFALGLSSIALSVLLLELFPFRGELGCYRIIKLKKIGFFFIFLHILGFIEMVF